MRRTKEEQAAAAQAASLLEGVSEKDAPVMVDIITVACEVLASKHGAMVVMVDMEGNGRMDMLAVGNQFVIPDLLRAAPLIGGKIYADEPEVVQ